MKAWLQKKWAHMLKFLFNTEHTASRKEVRGTEQESRDNDYQTLLSRQHELAQKAHYYEVRAKLAALRRHQEGH